MKKILKVLFRNIQLARMAVVGLLCSAGILVLGLVSLLNTLDSIPKDIEGVMILIGVVGCFISTLMLFDSTYLGLGRMIGHSIFAGVLSILFLIITIPFLSKADGLSFEEKAAIGGENMIRVVIFYGLLVAIFSFFMFRKKKFRYVSSLLIGTWMLGTSIVFILGNQNSNSNAKISNDNCNEQKTIAVTKSCTVLIMRNDGGHGTGFSIKPGFLITNKHVVEGAKSLTTWINGEKKLSMWNYSPTMDIAILKLPEEIPTCNWYESSKMQLAETLYAIGWPNNPTGDSTITKGIYSRTNTYDGGLEFIQTDAAINPGNSGGPLTNKCGVVGINTLKEVWTNENLPRPLEGLGNALSSRMLVPLVNQLLSEGKDGTAIPKTAKSYRASNPSSPSSSPTLDIESIRRYLSNVREARESWRPVEGQKPKQEMDSLIDLFNRQIAFCETLLGRLSDGKRPSQDDLFMWDSVVKMSYESKALADRLNSIR